MNPKGNDNIGHTKKYNREMRLKISKLIRSEWAQAKDTYPSAEDFAEQALGALKREGIKSPDGTVLTLRGVKYQVQRTGITFKGRKGKIKSFNKPMIHPIETRAERMELVKTLSKIPLALQGVLDDENLSPKQRRSMFEAYFEINK